LGIRTKLWHFIPLLIIPIIGIGFLTPAFAQYTLPIVVTTDKSSYSDGETIIISGEVSDLLSGYAVTLQVIDPNGDLIILQQLDVGADKMFSTELTAGGSLWEDSGTYTITVLYGTSARTAETTFYFQISQQPSDCGPYQIFQNGQCVDIGFITITVSTDRLSYKEGDIIRISGKVSDILENFAVSLQVVSPQGLRVTVQQLDVSYSGSFSTELTAGGPLWEDSGTYTIKVLYARGDISAETEFYFQSSQQPSDCGPNQVFQLGLCQDIGDSGPQAFTIDTDQPSYDDGDTIRISGNVGTVSASYPDQPVSIIVIGPDGKTVAIAQTIPSSNGSFSHILIVGGSMQISGVYEVTATYGTQKSTTTFSFESSTPSPIQLNIGEVYWLKASYPASGIGVVRVIDPDMNLDPEAVDNFDVDVWSDSDAGGIDLTVTETNEATGIFEGIVFFTTIYESSGHRLRVSEGDTITAEYQDNTLPDPYTSSDVLDITGTAFIQSDSPPPIMDTTPPKILQPKDIVVDASDSNGAFVTYEVLAIDNEDEIVKPSCSPYSGSLFSIGDTQVVCSAFDSSGNAAPQKSFLVTVNAPSLLIPDWIKEVAAFWCDDKIDDASFIDGIQYLIENGIIVVQATTSGSGGTQEIPSWVKNNACWWSQGLIADEDFASGLKYLIEIGVIKI